MKATWLIDPGHVNVELDLQMDDAELNRQVEGRWLPSELPQMGTVSFEGLRRQLDIADLNHRGSILEFVRTNRDRVVPLPDDQWMCDELITYYLDCIARTDGCVDMLDTPLEAAEALVHLFNWLLSPSSQGRPRAVSVAERLTNLFRNSSPEIRYCIETGFLEHILETPTARPFFALWSEDPVLADSYRAALSWGLAHSIEENT